MMLRPDAVVSTVTEVTPDFLRTRGVRALMVDLDDTLLAAGSDLLEPLFGQWLESLRCAGVLVVILSNGTQARVARWAQELGVVGLPLMGKPLGRAFAQGLAQLGTPAHETAMVGDQLFTDVLGANLAGMVSILVTPLSPGKLLHTRALRRVEKLLLKHYRLTLEGDAWPSSR
jgi:HAD superfamily phosphatase (TIGR01668 family)